jgi:hypothetical protein
MEDELFPDVKSSSLDLVMLGKALSERKVELMAKQSSAKKNAG